MHVSPREAIMSGGHLHRLILASMLFCFGILGGNTVYATPVQVLGVELESNLGRTRIVFTLSEPTPYKVFVLKEPFRVVVDFQNTDSKLNYSRMSLEGTEILRIRTAVQPDARYRHVFDMSRATKPLLYEIEPPQDGVFQMALEIPTEKKSDNMVGAAELTSVDKPPKSEAGHNLSTAPRVEAASRMPESDTTRSNNNSEWSGYLSFDARLFFHSPAFPQQDSQNASLAFQPEYYVDWADGNQRFAFKPFIRYDANDKERTHADIRELYWRLELDKLIIKAGADIVFWGVTESQHLVDIINQTDLVENIDGEDKLGQPMLTFDYLTGWGNLQLYLLPYFRERTFPGEHGRLRTTRVVDTDKPLYESSKEQHHTDFAVRWSHYVGDWDIGLAHFSGTSRQPLLLPSETGNEQSLVPLYLQIDQTSLDVQVTREAWLWKLEAIYNQNKLEDYFAYVGGFEHTNFGVAGTTTDLGLLLEYHFDERDERSTTGLQNDFFLGFRLNANDLPASTLLAGIIIDLDTQSRFLNIEASRRLGESWTLSLEGRFLSNIHIGDALYFIRDDDYIEIQLTRFY